MLNSQMMPDIFIFIIHWYCHYIFILLSFHLFIIIISTPLRYIRFFWYPLFFFFQSSRLITSFWRHAFIWCLLRYLLFNLHINFWCYYYHDHSLLTNELFFTRTIFQPLPSPPFTTMTRKTWRLIFAQTLWCDDARGAKMRKRTTIELSTIIPLLFISVIFILLSYFAFFIS